VPHVHAAHESYGSQTLAAGSPAFAGMTEKGMRMTSYRPICVGVILGAHGVQGQVRLRSFTDDPESLFKYKPLTDETGQQVMVPHKKGVTKDGFIASFKGVTDRDQAEAMRGTRLFIARSSLPPVKRHEYYEADLVGLRALAENKKEVGLVIAVHNYGAGTFLEIQPVKGKSFMLPFTDSCVPRVDISKGHITVAIPKGWLEEEKPKTRKKKS